MSVSNPVPSRPYAPDVAHVTSSRVMNPYLAGFGLGLVLLAAFLVMGRGLGATAAFGSVVAAIAGAISPDWTAASPALKNYFADPPATNWTFYLIAGAFVGALVSGLLAHRARFRIEHGPHLSVQARLALAFCGGALAAIGAKLAKGCTSGQALTGGAQLNVGSWVFMLAVFAGAYLLAYFVRKEWQ
ncbi:MAG: YeeE/YedE thiosulfate transporter family protein [Gemmatimonadota bacterium]